MGRMNRIQHRQIVVLKMNEILRIRRRWSVKSISQHPTDFLRLSVLLLAVANAVAAPTRSLATPTLFLPI